jgi:imidazolonepropionase-like amidohydrolase
MTKRLTTAVLFFILIVPTGPAASVPATGADEVLAVTGARIVPVSGPDIAQGTILVRGGRIEAVGAGIAVPEGARVIDASGLTAYPGMIDAYSSLGLVEISGVAATVDNRETGRFNPQVRALEAIRYDSMHIPIARSNGITAALVAPSGGVLAGQSCLLALDGWTHREMALKSPAFLHVELPGIPRRGGFAARRGGEARETADKILGELKDLFDGARLYQKRRQAAAGSILLPHPQFDETYEALLPAVDGALPLMISVQAEKDILAAIRFVEEQKVKAVFYGAHQAWKAAEAVKKAGIPVVLGSLYEMPPVWEDGYDALYRNPVILHEAGVKIAFSSSSASVAKDLPYHAAKASAFGLDRTEALKAVTLNTAEILGLGDALGSLEPGKRADIVLADGDILESGTKIRRVFIAGRETDLSNRTTELLEKFRRDR